ncbi:hypothetical protein ILUMI_11040 [Ignelater luminosus]|uniref:MD-2-related lipid-recognition domain-containing protein n=1 Tax=Ignelater luminosus TaxID=2038154 RepID=A0A8K0D5U0_IGNLU|nr:hypothetical protein ILUMI_11040 [Ignelater luminosus]
MGVVRKRRGHKRSSFLIIKKVLSMQECTGSKDPFLCQTEDLFPLPRFRFNLDHTNTVRRSIEIQILFLISVIFIELNFQAQSAANFIIERCYPCENVPNQKINYSVNPKTFSHPQVLDVTLITPIPLGDQLKFIMIIDLENTIGVKSWQRLVKLEDDFCRAMHSYMGSFAYQMETAMGIQPRGVCPIPKGHYHAVNYTADYSLMRLQAFPFGRLRLTIKYLEKSTKDILLCTITLVTNKH